MRHNTPTHPDQWIRNAVVYQIYPRSFQDSNGDGIGDLKGIVRRLDTLKALGVTALWLCPFYRSPMKDNGYDISDYYAIQPEFGTMEDMDELIREARARDIDIIIDMVLNHTSDQHEWFQKAVSDRESPYRDFYIFKDSVEGLSKLRSNFGGSSWTQLPDGTWYLHAFAPQQPDLNWDNPKLRGEIYSMMNWWLDKGVRGFRMDAITFIKKNMSFPPVPADGSDGRAYVGKVCLNQPGIMDYLKEMRDATYGPRGALTVAEAPGVPSEDLPAYIGQNGVFSMIFDFSYTDIDLYSGDIWAHQRPWTFAEFKQKLFANQLTVQKTGWAANYLENHDQPRSLSKYFTPAQIQRHHGRLAKLLGTLFFFLRGTPFIYQGQEIGMINAHFNAIDELDDVNSIGQYERCLEEGLTAEEAMASINRRSRDHARTPMQWENRPGFGFSDAAPWLACNTECPACNVEAQRGDPDSVWAYYRSMIGLRNHSLYADALIDGAFIPDETGDELISYRREGAAHTVHVTVNVTETEVDASHALPKGGRVLLGNCGKTKCTERFEPFEARVWLEEN